MQQDKKTSVRGFLVTLARMYGHKEALLLDKIVQKFTPPR